MTTRTDLSESPPIESRAEAHRRRGFRQRGVQFLELAKVVLTELATTQMSFERGTIGVVQLTIQPVLEAVVPLGMIVRLLHGSAGGGAGLRFLGQLD